MNSFNFENLTVYQRSVLFANNIYSLTKSWPKEEIYGLTSQIRRAAVSIALNIAEGSSRSKKDFAHFLDISRGSCYETITALKIALDQKMIKQDEYLKSYEELNQITKSINALKKAVEN